jgi:DNA gyrase inhibitor GyrI
LNGDHQKVIAYVYYDDPDNTMTESRKYFYGIEVNALMNKKFYKDWKMWIYHDVDEGSDKNR